MNYYETFMEEKVPNFFELSKKEQDLKKKDNPEWGDEYELLLYSVICNLRGDLNKLYEAELDPIVELKFNKEKLKYNGVGDNNIQIIGHFDDEKSTIDYETLLDYDKDIYDIRVKMTQELLKTKNPPKEEYRLQLLDVMGRAELTNKEGQKEFKYLFFNSIADIFESEIERVGIELISKLIPHEYEAISEGEVLSKNPQDLDDYNLLSYKVVAADGKEQFVLKIRDYAIEKMEEITREALNYFKTNEIHKVIKMEVDMEDGCEIYYYFTTEQAAGSIRLEHWESDCKKYEVDTMNDYAFVLKEAVQKMEKCINEKYNKLMENFNPDIPLIGRNIVQQQVSNAEIIDMNVREELIDFIEDNKHLIDNEINKSRFKIVEDDEGEDNE